MILYSVEFSTLIGQKLLVNFLTAAIAMLFFIFREKYTNGEVWAPMEGVSSVRALEVS